MGPQWENPGYGQHRRRAQLALVLMLIVIIAAAFLLLRRDASDSVVLPAAKETPIRSTSVSQANNLETQEPTEEIPLAGIEPEAPVMGDDATRQANALQRAADELFAAGKFAEALEVYRNLAPTDPFNRSRAGLCLVKLGRWSEAVSELQATLSVQANNFAARKLLALALYRQNELELALEQVKGALELQVDEELLDLQAKLQTEILVQRNYDNARTANFVVLFDGYEHDEMKYIVLDILKSAYAEIGKELDYFPEQPISVILYTAKDFFEVTRAPMWAGGMFGKLDGKIRLPVQGAAGHEPALRRVLYHEYTHALLYIMAPSCPLWLHEGLAQYFSGDKPVNVGQLIPLPLLVNGFPSEQRAAYAAYMESLQVVVDLVEEHGMSRLRGLLDKLGSGGNLEAAFASSYGQPFSRWAKQWRPLQQ